MSIKQGNDKGKSTMNDHEATELAKMMTAPDMFPECRKAISRSLLDYFKDKLYRDPKQPIPTVRRMW